ncbi:MAG: DUF2975 domain-containing protein [Clostridia bacterium]|nr:DUF2975 domain-containing protein [Clostridia bacterium]
MYQKSLPHYISKILVDILFYASIVCTLMVPVFSRQVYMWIQYPYESYFLPFTLIVFVSGIFCVLILYHLKRLFKTLMVGDPFVEGNVVHLRRIALYCGCISLIYAVKCLFLFTLLTFVVAGAFCVGCLLCLTLKDLFKQAVNYKAENELTI